MKKYNIDDFKCCGNCENRLLSPEAINNNTMFDKTTNYRRDIFSKFIENDIRIYAS